MIRKMKDLLVTLATVAAFAVPVMVPAVVSAATPDISGNLCAGSNLNTAGSDNTCAGSSQAVSQVNNILITVVNIFSLIVGIVAVIMIIIGGLRYITSGGESSNVSTAKNTIIFAIVGLVIVALAQVIVHYVLAKTTSSVNGG